MLPCLVIAPPWLELALKQVVWGVCPEPATTSVAGRLRISSEWNPGKDAPLVSVMVMMVGATICCRLAEQKLAHYQLIGFPPLCEGLGLHRKITINMADHKARLSPLNVHNTHVW